MKNPFRIIWLMFRYRKPSRVTEMKAVKENFWLRGNYAAMTFFGYILVHSQDDADFINSISANTSDLKRHETIHLRQAQSLHNSWLLFYLLYFWYYLRALPQNRRRRNAAYYINPFEMEAYEHMYDEGYLAECANGANGWREYAKMKPSQRLKVSKS